MRKDFPPSGNGDEARRRCDEPGAIGQAEWARSVGLLQGRADPVANAHEQPHRGIAAASLAADALSSPPTCAHAHVNTSRWGGKPLTLQRRNESRRGLFVWRLSKELPSLFGHHDGKRSAHSEVEGMKQPRFSGLVGLPQDQELHHHCLPAVACGCLRLPPLVTLESTCRLAFSVPQRTSAATTA